MGKILIEMTGFYYIVATAIIMICSGFMWGLMQVLAEAMDATHKQKKQPAQVNFSNSKKYKEEMDKIINKRR